MIESKASKKEALNSAERAKITELRGIRDNDIPFIARWAADPETHSHLRYLPEPPQEGHWSEDNMSEYFNAFVTYYNNYGEPMKITPLVAVNQVSEPISALTIRWRGNPDVPRISGKTASIESFIVDPKLRHLGVGKGILSAALSIIFDEYKGYGEEGAKEVRLWIFTDSQAGEYNKNINLFSKYGFDIMAGDYRNFCEKRGIKNPGNRNAQLYKLTKDMWERKKQEDPELTMHAPIDMLSLRV
jgi:ribosomal protein S18 acetylase RimI-like enzyme